MKKFITIVFLSGMTLYAFPQAQGVYTNCPASTVFSQNYVMNAYWYVWDAWDKDTANRPVLENYSASSSFNSLRFFGAWVVNGQFYNPACHPESLESFIIEIYDQDPVPGGVSPVHSFTLDGTLTKIGYADYAKNISRFAWNEPMFQVDISFPLDIQVLNGWISIRNVNDPGRPCSFGLVFSPYTTSASFYNGHFTEQTGGGYTGSWENPITGSLFMCLSHNAVPFAGSPVRKFDQAFDNWDDVVEASLDQGISVAPCDDYTATGSFDQLTLWGGWVFGGNSSCSIGTTESFQVEIFDANPTTGATPVQTYTRNGSLTPTGQNFYTFGNQVLYRVDIFFDSPITLTSGWIRVQGINPSGRDCKFGLLYSNSIANGTFLDANLVSQNGGLFFSLSSPCPTSFANAGADVTVYYGYPPMASAWLNATGGIWYDWSPTSGIRTYSGYFFHKPNPVAEPSVSTTYSVIVTNADGCIDDDDVTVTVIDVRCGPNLDKVSICYNNKTLCVPQNKVAGYLTKGATLGACNKSGIIDEVELEAFSVSAYPNPFNDRCTISVDQPEGSYVTIQVTDMLGRQVSKIYEGYLDSGSHQFEWKNPGTAESLYFLKAGSNNEFKVIKLMTQK